MLKYLHNNLKTKILKSKNICHYSHIYNYKQSIRKMMVPLATLTNTRKMKPLTLATMKTVKPLIKNGLR